MLPGETDVAVSPTIGLFFTDVAPTRTPVTVKLGSKVIDIPPGKADYLVGLKENVILGHLVPAGTGFSLHQQSEVRINAPDGDGQDGDGVSADVLAVTPA